MTTRSARSRKGLRSTRPSGVNVRLRGATSPSATSSTSNCGPSPVDAPPCTAAPWPTAGVPTASTMPTSQTTPTNRSIVLTTLRVSHASLSQLVADDPRPWRMQTTPRLARRAPPAWAQGGELGPKPARIGTYRAGYHNGAVLTDQHELPLSK